MFEAVRRMIRGRKAPLLTYVIPNYRYEHLIGDCPRLAPRPDPPRLARHRRPSGPRGGDRGRSSRRHADPRITHLAFPGPVTTFKGPPRRVRGGHDPLTLPISTPTTWSAPRHAEHLLGAAPPHRGRHRDRAMSKPSTTGRQCGCGPEAQPIGPAPLEGKGGGSGGSSCATTSRSHSSWDAVYRTDALRDTYARDSRRTSPWVIGGHRPAPHALEPGRKLCPGARDRLPLSEATPTPSTQRRRSGRPPLSAAGKRPPPAYGLFFLHDTFRADDRRMSEMPWLFLVKGGQVLPELRWRRMSGS